MIENEKENLSKVQKILVDAGYTGEKFASKIKTIINANVEVIKRNELTYFCSITKKMNCRTKFCMIRKMQKIMKKLRTKTKH